MNAKTQCLSDFAVNYGGLAPLRKGLGSVRFLTELPALNP